MQPKNRSNLRIALGKKYYMGKRYFEWCFGGTEFALSIDSELKPYTVFEHRTPLLRKLKDVDMWLQYNKITNIKLAIKKIDGLIIYPGETFSFWKLVGKTTVGKGYVEGMVLSHGKFKPGVGGGLCQLSNLIYWMTLHTPLKVTERHRHSYDVFPDSDRKLPFGSGATCFYNYIDLRIANDTDQPYQLHLYLNDEYLMGEWRTTIEQKERYEVYQKEHWISHEYWGGYARHNTIFRKKYDQSSKLVDDEYITENHAIMMYEPLLSNRYHK
ncbi:MAG TPA: VanW family protein [Epulopiscium sp.]|nr:VanW family protein [Candidatus Epulonipiscium sp.]